VLKESGLARKGGFPVHTADKLLIINTKPYKTTFYRAFFSATKTLNRLRKSQLKAIKYTKNFFWLLTS